MMLMLMVIACLSKNAYDEKKCSHLIDALYECCAEFYARRGKDAKSVCCPREELLRLKLAQRGMGGGGGAEVKEGRRR